MSETLNWWWKKKNGSIGIIITYNGLPVMEKRSAFENEKSYFDFELLDGEELIVCAVDTMIDILSIKLFYYISIGKYLFKSF